MNDCILWLKQIEAYSSAQPIGLPLTGLGLMRVANPITSQNIGVGRKFLIVGCFVELVTCSDIFGTVQHKLSHSSQA